MSCCQDNSTTVTTAPVRKAASAPAAKQGCQCEGCRTGGTCCELVCYERPNYFCGHLLTDADLLREQSYFREKNKLYHRALHGHGIVCGLRIFCDGECEGHVRIEKGYAIDDCGNDLVVCNPLRFNVLKALRDKGWIVDEPKPDPCKPDEKVEDCKTRQCFYVAACYAEEPADFVAPFVPGCKPMPADCEPTRIREIVTFDVLNTLPPKAGVLADLEKRLEGCFDLFSKGPFAQYLRDNAEAIEAILEDKPEARRFDCADLYCNLRGLLLLYLKKHPDRYNCTLAADIAGIAPPKHDNERDKGCRESLCRLIELAVRHAFTCAINEFAPQCEPGRSACVVLGTVEVEHGEIVHVCNCPREYVWTFANFYEVLLATLISDKLCVDKDKDKDKARWERAAHEQDEDPCKPKGRHVCCSEIDVSCAEIVRLLNINPRAMHYRGMVGLEAAMMMREALADAFDFTRAGVYSPQMFSTLTPAQAEAAAAKLDIRRTAFEAARAEPMPIAPFEVLRRIGLATPAEPLVLTKADKTVSAGRAEVPIAEVQAIQKRMQTPIEELGELRKRIAALEKRLGTAPEKPNPPPPAPKKRGPR